MRLPELEKSVVNSYAIRIRADDDRLFKEFAEDLESCRPGLFEWIRGECLHMAEHEPSVIAEHPAECMLIMVLTVLQVLNTQMECDELGRLSAPGDRIPESDI